MDGAETEMAELIDSGELAGGERRSDAALRLLVERVRDGSVEAAREVRRLTRTSARNRRRLSGAVEPLVRMLREGGDEREAESAVLALLNLAVRDERNKIRIVEAGAVDPLIGLLQCDDQDLREYATAAMLTLSAAAANKNPISTSGTIPHLVKILGDGSPQARMDAVMALYNLTTIQDNLHSMLTLQSVPLLVNLLKDGPKSSKTADKCCALLESLVAFDQGRTTLTAMQGGILAVVEVLEEGSPQGREHAVGLLLTMCESDRDKYREAILNEGVIPGLLELTVHGNLKSRLKAHKLLEMLRNSPYSRSRLQPDTLENIVSNIASHIDGDDQDGKAKKMLAEMVKVSMEQSLKHLQQRASA